MRKHLHTNTDAEYWDLVVECGAIQSFSQTGFVESRHREIERPNTRENNSIGCRQISRVRDQPTGNIHALIHICKRQDVSNSVARVMNMMEPAMLLIMGVVAGFIVISMLMAVFSINDVNI